MGEKPLEAAKCERRSDGSTEMRIRTRTVGESAREVRKPVGGEDWLPVRVNVRIYGPAQRRAPSHDRLLNSELPRNRGKFNACLESGPNCVQLTLCRRSCAILGRHLTGQSCCTGRHLFSRRTRRQPITMLGFLGQRRKQRIDLGIIQPLQRSGQIVGQEMTRGRTLVGLPLRDGFGLRRPHCRRRRKQVGCCLFLTTGRHGATLRPAAHRGNGLGEKENQVSVLFTRTATDVSIQACRTSHPYGTAWNLFLSLGEPPFVRDWARAAFSYPSLPSCGEIVWPAWLPPRCFTSQESNADRYGFVAARSARTAHERTAIPEVDYGVSGGSDGRRCPLG